MNEQTRQALLKLIAEAKPASLLSIGPLGRDFYAPGPGGNPDCEFTRVSAEDAPAQLPRLGRFDFAVATDTLERLAKPEGAALIARLRDVHAARFALAVSFSTARAWSHAELVAFGLTRIDLGVADACALYAFDIAHYKHTPDWLNSDNWAHPERFDKYRW